MNEINELADNLGVSEDSQETTELFNDEVKEVTEVNDKDQLEAGERLIKKCKKIYQKGRENDLIWRWLIGQEVKDAYDHTSKYESGILKKLSEELFMSISDLSRFHKFYNSFNKEMLLERAEVGYTWSHFKIINDLPDGNLKERMVNRITEENDVPKVKELQTSIHDEKEAMNQEDGSQSSGSSDSPSSSSGASIMKAPRGALRVIDKLLDYLTDVHTQEKEGVDYNSDKQEEKYNMLMDEINDRLKQIHDFHEKIFSN